MHAQVKIATRPAPRRGLFGRGCGSAARARSEGHLPLEREVEDAGEQQLTAFVSTSPLREKKKPVNLDDTAMERALAAAAALAAALALATAAPVAARRRRR